MKMKKKKKKKKENKKRIKIQNDGLLITNLDILPLSFWQDLGIGVSLWILLGKIIENYFLKTSIGTRLRF